ncbi:hypothetical protein, partial [Enterobacter intestinihominis]
LRPGKPVVFISAQSGFFYINPSQTWVPKKRLFASIKTLFNCWNVSILLSCICFTGNKQSLINKTAPTTPPKLSGFGASGFK